MGDFHQHLAQPSTAFAGLAAEALTPCPSRKPEKVKSLDVFDSCPHPGDEVSDDATCNLCLTRLGRGTVPLTSVAAPGTPRAAASARGLPAVSASTAPPCDRPRVLGMAVLSVVRVAKRPGIRAAAHCDRLAAQAISRPLATAEPAMQARPSYDCQGGPRSHPDDVADQSNVGRAPDRGRTAQAGHRRGQVGGRDISGAASEAAITDMENLPEEPRAGSGVPGFPCRADDNPQSTVRPAYPGP